MNFYCITYRLDSDKRGQKRYWEDFANNRDHAIELLSEYVFKNICGGQTSLFDPKIIILLFSEYLDIFK